MIKSIINIIFQIREGASFALDVLRLNKLRTFLSLFGITIGIFSIITVFSAIDSLENHIHKIMSQLGSNVLYIDKYPWQEEQSEEEGGKKIAEYKWWEYYKRPAAKYSEYEYISRNSKMYDKMCYNYVFSGSVKHKNNFYNAEIETGTYHMLDLKGYNIEHGRYFTLSESNMAAPVTIIGNTIANELFDTASMAVGKIISVKGRKLTVIGVMEEMGDAMSSSDKVCILPINIARNMVNERYVNTTLIVQGKKDVNLNDLKAEITTLLRAVRKLGPSDKNNFSINSMDMIIAQLDKMFSIINIAGGIIGMFSIIVGGFGIANIMFVSVRERMTQIGIQKALGAKSYVIMTQFLFEAALLSVMGGVLGIFIVWIATLIVNSVADFEFILSLKNIIIGILISSIVGLIAGFIPSYQASKMQPVKAIFNV